MRWRRSFVGAALVAVGVAVVGREPIGSGVAAIATPQGDVAAPSGALFRSGIDVVTLNVSVSGRDGRLVSGLSLPDFQVLDNNRLQQIAFLLPGDRVPLAVILLIDRSSSMLGTKLDRAMGAAAAFVGAAGPDDLIGLLAFNETVTRLVPLGRDHGAVERELPLATAEGKTALYEAVLVAARDLDRARRRLSPGYRFALVVLSDGEDTASHVSFDDIVDDTRRADIVVYPVSLRSDERGRWLAAPFTLAQLAFDTGGKAISTGDPNSLPPIYQQIHSELREMYTLGYSPMPGTRDGMWHAVSVRLPGRDAVVRTRKGYYAGGPRPREK